MNDQANALWPCWRRPRVEVLADHEPGLEAGRPRPGHTSRAARWGGTARASPRSRSWSCAGTPVAGGGWLARSGMPPLATSRTSMSWASRMLAAIDARAPDLQATVMGRPRGSSSRRRRQLAVRDRDGASGRCRPASTRRASRTSSRTPRSVGRPIADRAARSGPGRRRAGRRRRPTPRRRRRGRRRRGRTRSAAAGRSPHGAPRRPAPAGRGRSAHRAAGASRHSSRRCHRARCSSEPGRCPAAKAARSAGVDDGDAAGTGQALTADGPSRVDGRWPAEDRRTGPVDRGHLAVVRRDTHRSRRPVAPRTPSSTSAEAAGCAPAPGRSVEVRSRPLGPAPQKLPAPCVGRTSVSPGSAGEVAQRTGLGAAQLVGPVGTQQVGPAGASRPGGCHRSRWRAAARPARPADRTSQARCSGVWPGCRPGAQEEVADHQRVAVVERAMGERVAAAGRGDDLDPDATPAAPARPTGSRCGRASRATWVSRQPRAEAAAAIRQPSRGGSMTTASPSDDAMRWVALPRPGVSRVMRSIRRSVPITAGHRRPSDRGRRPARARRRG